MQNPFAWALEEFFNGSGGFMAYGGSQQGNSVQVVVTSDGTGGATNPDGTTCEPGEAKPPYSDAGQTMRENFDRWVDWYHSGQYSYYPYSYEWMASYNALPNGSYDTSYIFTLIDDYTEESISEEDFPPPLRLRVFGEKRGFILLGDESNNFYIIKGMSGTESADDIQNTGIIFGLAGNDILRGGVGTDGLYGGEGDDFLYGGAGGDVLDGGAGGFDLAMYDGASERVIASLSDASQNTADAAGDTYSGIEGLSGTAFNDRLTGDDGDNYLYGRLGDDMLIGSGGNDVLDADNGNDTLSGGAGADSLYGGYGNDILSGDAGNDYVSGGAGNDSLFGGAGADILDGGAGGADLAMYDGASTGVIASLSARSQNTNDAAGDTYVGIEGLSGTAFNDRLSGDDGANYLYGRLGDDVLAGGAGADLLDGGAGTDWVSYASSTSGVYVSLADGRGYTGLHGGTDANGDTYFNVENVEGGNGVDILAGNAAANHLRGLGSDDILQGGGGADTLEGGAGFNWASYSTATAGVTANLGTPSQNTGDAAGDVYISMHGLQGSNYGDKLVGDAGGNAIAGLSGNDTLDGGDGADILEGGAGADRFLFNTRPNSLSNVDQIADFSVAEDKIQLDRSVFTAFSTSNAVASWEVSNSGGPNSADQHLIYNQSTGDLFYDIDGSGKAVQVKIAVMAKGLTLTANHFELVGYGNLDWF